MKKNTRSEEWYIEHILPYQAKLHSWLSKTFPTARDLDDVVQEAIFKVMKAHSSGPIINPQAYLFFTARNLVLSRLRKHKFEVPPLEHDFDITELEEDVDNPLELITRKEEIQLLIDAIKSLPKRSRQVLTLRKVYGYSLKETASKLGISESTVGNLSAIGIEKCEAYFRVYKLGENTK